MPVQQRNSSIAVWRVPSPGHRIAASPLQVEYSERGKCHSLKQGGKREQIENKVKSTFQGGLIYKLQDPRGGQAGDATGMHRRPLIFPQTLPKEKKEHLVGGGSLLLVLLEPALLNGGGLTGGGLTLNLDLLALIGGQLASQIGLLGRRGSLGKSELLDVGFGVTGLDGDGLVGLEFTEVQVLDGVGWRGASVRDRRSDMKDHPQRWLRNFRECTYPGGQRRSGRSGERQRPVAERHG